MIQKRLSTFLIFLALAAFSLGIARPALSAEALFRLEAEPSLVSIGDLVTVSLHIIPKDFSADKIELITFEPDPDLWEKQSGWQRNWTPGDKSAPGPWCAQLRPFKVGELDLPDVSVVYRDEDGEAQQAEINGEKITVRSVRPDNAQESHLIGLRGPASVARDWGWLWLLACVILAVALVTWLLVRFIEKRTRPAAQALPATPELPAGLWALREIERRRRLPVCANGPAKQVFSLVSEVIRLYLKRRYGIEAIDMTTRECLRAMYAISPGDEVLKWLQAFLDECDLVKFTRHEATRQRWDTIWDDARLIVQGTTSPEELDAPDAGTPATGSPSENAREGVSA